MKSASVLVSLVLAAMLLVGCATSAKNLASIHPGMNKSQVMQILGTPDGSGVDGSREFMNYRLTENALTDWEPTPYTVILQDGKVVSYGRQNQVH